MNTQVKREGCPKRVFLSPPNPAFDVLFSLSLVSVVSVVLLAIVVGVPFLIWAPSFKSEAGRVQSLTMDTWEKHGKSSQALTAMQECLKKEVVGTRNVGFNGSAKNGGIVSNGVEYYSNHPRSPSSSWAMVLRCEQNTVEQHPEDGSRIIAARKKALPNHTWPSQPESDWLRKFP